MEKLNLSKDNWVTAGAVSAVLVGGGLALRFGLQQPEQAANFTPTTSTPLATIEIPAGLTTPTVEITPPAAQNQTEQSTSQPTNPNTTAAPPPAETPPPPVPKLPTPQTTSPQVIAPPPPHGIREESQFGSNTFRDYRNASGVGPHIEVRDVVSVVCYIFDPNTPIKSTGGYWYRLSPGFNPTQPDTEHYAAANTFVNGQRVDGPPVHFGVVPLCADTRPQIP